MTTDVADKWGQQIAERGFAQIPNYLLLLNQFLEKERRLSPVEMLILLQLVGAWWKKDAMPFPSMATLAMRCGVSDRQVQRSINHLVELNLIERTQRHTEKGIRANNSYDLKPLISLLGDVAKAFPNGYPRTVTARGRKLPFAPVAADGGRDAIVLDAEGAAFFEAQAEIEAKAKAKAQIASKGGLFG